MNRIYKLLVCGVFLVLAACQGQTKEELVQQGVQLMQQGNPLGAVVCFRNALEQDPNYTDARYQLGLAYLKTKKLEEAEKELKKVQLQEPGRHDVLLDLAMISLALNRVPEAEKDILQFLEKNGKTSRSQHYLGLVQQVRGDLPGAEALLLESIDLDDKNAEPFLSLTRLYLSQGRIADAKQLLQLAIKSFPKNEALYWMLATVEARSGNRAEAVNAYDQVVRLNPEAVGAYYFAGIFSLDGEDLSTSGKYLKTMQQRFAEHPATTRLQGMTYFVQGDLKNAAISLRKSIKQLPDLAGYYFLGLTEFRLKNYELALSQFQKALDLNPDHLQSRVLLGMTLLHQKRIDDCIYQLTQVLQENDRFALAHNVIGSAYLAKGDYDVAIEHFDRAIILDPQLADPHLKKGLLNLSQKNESGAELELEKALDAAPESLNTRFLLASLYLKQRNYQGVIDLMQAGLDGTSQDGIVYNYMAAAYLAQKKFPEGIEALQKAKAAKADYLAPYFNLANAYLVMQKRDLAEGEYQALLNVAPNNVKALISLASLQEMSGEGDTAKATYLRARATDDPQGFLALAGYCARSKDVDAFSQVVEDAFATHPKHPDILRLRGRFLLSQKQFSEAIATFKSLEEIQPETAAALLAASWLASGEQDKALSFAQEKIRAQPEKSVGYLLLSTVQKELGQKEEAEKTLQNGFSHVRDPELLLQLGSLYAQTQRLPKAEKLFRDLKKDYPAFAPGLYALGMLQDQRGYKQEAESLYREVLEKDKKHIGALNNLAYLYAENNGDLEESLTLAIQAFRSDPSNPVLLDTLGYALIKNERYQEAVNVLTKASRLLPNMATVHLHLGQALIGAEKNNEAQQALEHVVALQTEPESSQAQKLLDRLKH
nr:XrtA/PEP-CTERM system TPR-repeat protein PrsT [uncultured Desulfuromonas sp.]